jgi:manganese/iron transport system permease protein/iron/zinc/copper transport system permease protein
VLELVLEPMRYEFFRNALLAAVMVGVLAGITGIYIVLRGLSYIGHGLSHAAFGGAVAGYLLKVNFYAAATASTFLAAFLIQRISDGKRVRGDAAIGIVTNAAFAVGVALISLKHRFERSFEAALFGNILGVTDVDLAVMASVLVLCAVVIAVLYRNLLFAAFDDETASVAGINTKRLWAGFSFLLALAIIASMNIVGVTMISAALVMPAATARMLTDSFYKMTVLSPIIGAITTVVGLFLSYHLNVASGATIVLFGAILFGCAWLVRGTQLRIASRHVHLHRHGDLIHAHPHLHGHGHPHVHVPFPGGGQLVPEPAVSPPATPQARDRHI